MWHYILPPPPPRRRRQLPPPPMPASKPEPKNTPSPGEEWYKLVRDIVLFVAGLLGVAYEAITPGETRIPLLVMYATMLGLPAIFRFPQQSQKDMTDE